MFHGSAMRAAAAATMLAALAGCATVAGVVGESWSAALTGNQVVGGPGDSHGTGTVRITADSTTDQVCYDLTVQGIGRPTEAHLYRGARGVSGPPLIPFLPPITGRSKECLSVDKQLAAAIIADPAGFYVAVATARYPRGAIRGQLPPR